ncbi:MAG: iron complex outermembrane receptor protein [Cyclobacteriaceae bacterium]|jgi:iron complex outermembrane receptor protein
MIRILLVSALSIWVFCGHSQSQIQGRVIDQKTTEPIAGVLIFSASDTIVTDPSGSFTINGTKALILQIVGYQTQKISNPTTGLTIELTPSIISLNEVTITAGIRQDKIKNTAGAISVISKEMLQRDAPYAITDAMNRVPGVYMHSGTNSTSRITIRGIGSRTLFGTSKIKAYYGQIPLTDGSGSSTIEDIDQSLIDRMEVLKGPNSSSYGAGLAGVVRINPYQAPANTTSVQSGLTLGSFGRLRWNNTVTHADEKKAISVTYTKTQNDGYRENSAYDREQIGILSNWYLSEKSTLSLIGTYTDLQAFIPSALNVDDYKNNPESAAFTWGAAKGYEAYDKFLTGLSLDQQLSSNWALNSSVFFTYRDAYEPRPFNILEETTTSLGTRNVINGQFNLLTFSAGFELFKDRYDWGEYVNTAPMDGSAQGAPISNFVEDRTYYNIFAETSMDATSKLKLIAGLNFNSTQYILDDRQNEDSLSGSYGFDPVLSPRVGVVYHLRPNQHLFANVSHGFSPPTLEETLNPDGQINLDIQPEKGWNYEVGLRGNSKGFTYDLVVYFMQIRDLLVAQRTDNDQYYGVNAGLNNHLGLDLYLNYTFDLSNNYQLNLFTTGSWMYYRFAEFVNEDVNYDGKRLTGVPELLLNPGIEILSESGLYGNINGQYVGEIPINDANSIYSDSYFILRSKLGYSLDVGNFRFDMNIGIENITNQKYASMLLINNTGFGGASPRYYYPGNPTNYFAGLNLTYTIKKKSQ